MHRDSARAVEETDAASLLAVAGNVALPLKRRKVIRRCFWALPSKLVANLPAGWRTRSGVETLFNKANDCDLDFCERMRHLYMRIVHKSRSGSRYIFRLSVHEPFIALHFYRGVHEYLKSWTTSGRRPLPRKSGLRMKRNSVWNFTGSLNSSLLTVPA